ncbi:MAG TPA: hypothetical protein VLN72_03125 [Gillisia sp.]|nr:hypothetical protein [Gillisia sp.]
MNRFTFSIVCLVLAIGLSGCSRKKDKFINRNYHAVTTEFNTLYNGNLALDLGTKQVADTYRENFWGILPVERMQVSEEIALPGTARNEHFNIAEEKAAKAIQKHSMLIAGTEKNPQIDEAYLLLGKARYYDQRFIPALESFNYILHKYPASNTINHARIWREKTNLRLENDKLAIKNLKKIIEGGKMKDQDIADAYATLAQAYINTGSLDSAVVPIRTAANFTRNTDEKGRYYYIEGQLYNFLQKRDSASLAFEKVIELNRKTPREYLVNAQLEKARNFDYSTGNTPELLAWLEEIESNRENRPFLDKIYFQKAEYYYQLDSIDKAIAYYNLSLRTPSQDNFLQSVNYETLGRVYFNNSQYRTAGAYYDSTLTRIPNTTRDYFVVKRRRDNLQELIQYEEIVEKNDSVLRFVAMSPEERLDYFTNYTNDLKATAISRAKLGEIEDTPALIPERRVPGAPPSLGAPNLGTTFYFYNPGRVAGGMSDFLRIWGPRELKDNWRTDPGGNMARSPEELDEVSELIIANNPQFNPRTYMDQIPSDQGIIDSLAAQRNNSYFRLGLIYKEKFGENELAAQRLKSLLEYTREERLVVPGNYYLHQIYLADGNNAEAERYKQTVLRDYPDSRYAASLLNPGQTLELETSAEDIYNQIYRLFEQGEYVEVLVQGERLREDYRDDELLPKIDLLIANATGRLYGFEAYKQALNQVAVNYPQTPEGQKALELYNITLPQLQNKEFNLQEPQTNVKLLYSYPSAEKVQALEVKEKIDKAIEELGYRKYSTSIDVYNQETIFVTVHGFESETLAEGFGELLQVNKKYSLNMQPVIISSENYRVVQLHKNLQDYIDLKSNSKPQ